MELLLDLKQRGLIGNPDGSAKSGVNAWGSPNLPPPGVPNEIDSMPLSRLKTVHWFARWKNRGFPRSTGIAFSNARGLSTACSGREGLWIELRQIAIEDADTRPTGGMGSNEGLVPRGLLVGVVGSMRGKHDQHSHVIVAVVHLPVVVGTDASGKEEGAGVPCKMALAGSHKKSRSLRRAVLEREVNGV